MADYISREAAKQLLCKFCIGSEICARTLDCNALKALHTVPAADVREVVTCGECKHKSWVQEPCHGKSVDYCRILERCVDKRFFCAAGERPNCGADMRGGQAHD